MISMLTIKRAQVQGENAMTGQKAVNLEGANPTAPVAESTPGEHQVEGQHKSKVEKVKEALHLKK